MIAVDTRRKRPRYEHAPATLDDTTALSHEDTSMQATAWDACDLSDSPYGTVQAFEATYRQVSQPRVISPHAHVQQGTMPTIVPIPTSDRSALLGCLSRIALSLEDARDMFSLFGDRVAPYLPWLFDTDFSDLPGEPLFALAALQVISRYLPGGPTLCNRLSAEVLLLLKNVLFDDPQKPYHTVLDTMKGLAIVYAYAEVGTIATASRANALHPDLLSIKGLIEAYAVRKMLNRPSPSNARGCLFWLWMYVQGS